MLVVAIVTLTFIITGQINTLAPIVTMPFLLTYACLDYAYFALAQTFDIQLSREQRFRTQSPTFDHDYDSTSRNNSITDIDNDLDNLFPERIRHKNLIVSTGKCFINYCTKNKIENIVFIIFREILAFLKIICI